MKAINWIKKLFTPIIWKTIWSETMDAKLSDGSKIKMAVFVKVNDKNNNFQCYASNGLGFVRNLEISWLVTQYPEIVVILDQHNIKY